MSLSIDSCPSSVQELTSFSISVSASDDSGIDHIDVVYNGTTQTINSSSGTVSFTAPAVSGSNVSTTLSATAYANDGGTKSTSKTITVIESIPTASIVSPIPISVQELTSFSISVSASDDSGIDHIDVVYNGTTKTVNASSGTVSFTAPAVSGNTVTGIAVKAYANDGGTFEHIYPNAITVVERIPTFITTSIPSSVCERSSFDVSVSASDDSGISKIDVTYNGTTQTINSSSGTVSFTTPAVSGSNVSTTLSATAYANDGGTVTISKTITVVERIPTFITTSIPSSVCERSSFDVSVSASDDSGIDHIDVAFNGTTKTINSSSGTVSFITPAVSGNTPIAITVKAYANDFGTRSTYKTIIVTEKVPTVSITSMPSSVYERSSFSVSVSASDDSGIKSVDVSFNGTTETINSGSGSVDFTAPSTSGSNITKSISVTAHANDGGSSSKTQNITIKESEPSISINAPSSITESASFNVSVSASDDSGISSINVAFNGTTKTISASSGTVSFTAPAVSGSNTSIAITVKAYANDGSTKSTSKTVTVVERVPTISITSIPSSVYEHSSFSVSVSASDDSGIDHISVSISGSSATINGNSGTVTLTAPSVSSSNETFTITATTTSNDGGTATATQDITVVESAPSVTITLIPSSVYERLSFDVSVSASDDSGIDHINVSISGSSKTITGGSGTARLTAPSTSGSSKSFTVTATAVATDGGTKSTTHAITVLEFGASVSVNSCPSSVGERQGFSVKASGSDDSGIDHISYTFNGTTKTASSGSSVSFTAPSTSGSNKSYTLSITAHANDGNTASTSRSITVVESGASIISCTYKDKARSGGKLDITVNGADDSGISLVSINYHGTVYTGSNNTPITIKCDRTNKKITDAFTATVTANDGNTVSGTYSFTLLPGMSFDKLFVARYIGLEATRILFGGGPMTILGRQLIGGSRII